MSFIQLEINWLVQVIRFRALNPTISLGYFSREISHFHQSKGEIILSQSFWEQVRPPAHTVHSSAYSRFVLEKELDFAERLLLILTATSQLYPKFIEAQILRADENPYHKIFSDSVSSHVGLIQSSATRVYLPTGITYLFLLTGNDPIQHYTYLYKMLHNEFLLLKNNLIALGNSHPAESLLGGLLMIRRDFLLSLLENPDELPGKAENQNNSSVIS